MKRTVKVKEAIYIEGRLHASLAEDDEIRGWYTGEHISTSTVINVEGSKYETRNTIYEVVDGQVYIPNQGE